VKTKTATRARAVPKAAPPAQLPVRIEPSDQQPAMLGTIERLAADPKFDVAKLEKLIALRNEERAHQAMMAYADSMAQAQGEIHTQVKDILRDKYNEQTESSYATLEAINTVIVPIYTRHGFSLQFGEEPAEGKPDWRNYTCICTHRHGHKERFAKELPADLAGIKGGTNKTMVQALGSSSSYAQRYIARGIFNVALKAEDKDGQQQPAELIDAEQLKQLHDKLTELVNTGGKMTEEEHKAAFNRRTSQLLKWLKCDTLDQLTVPGFKAAVDEIERTIAKAKVPAGATT
jgi:hypothetical protein